MADDTGRLLPPRGGESNKTRECIAGWKTVMQGATLVLAMLALAVVAVSVVVASNAGSLEVVYLEATPERTAGGVGEPEGARPTLMKATDFYGNFEKKRPLGNT